eukprot:TRINITY_DN13439_c0_g1_i1.p1 TRINITY_DN13439_c0_g1~~TRINITY_DN13439_c0_g1_i1.p1  ORF type:complete len:153 (-),score=50.08 TRINITY_DN13439_c0_g1_i1:606-1064(-)
MPAKKLLLTTLCLALGGLCTILSYGGGKAAAPPPRPEPIKLSPGAVMRPGDRLASASHFLDLRADGNLVVGVNAAAAGAVDAQSGAAAAPLVWESRTACGKCEARVTKSGEIVLLRHRFFAVGRYRLGQHPLPDVLRFVRDPQPKSMTIASS